MKRIHLSLLLCLASLLASAQEPLNGDSLASDFRYLVKELANTYMEQTLFRLPYTGMQGSISNSIQICFPGKDRCAHTLYPDLMPTYQDYQRYNFDVQTEILYLLDKTKSAPHSHTNPAEKYLK